MTQRAPDPADDASSQPDWSRRGAQLLAIVAVLVLIVIGWNLSQPDPVPQRQGAPSADFAEGETPAPYYYDDANNRHWDPAHGHWHQGPPPPGAQQQADPAADPTADPADIGAGEVPAPYHYDEQNNRHWDPDHGHWHQGPPPPGAQRN